jgi:hypothetical protein
MILRFDPLAYCIVLCLVGTMAGCEDPEPSTSSAPASSDALVIRGGWLFDGVGDARVRNTGIVNDAVLLRLAERLFWRSGVAQSARVGDWKLNVSGSDKVWLYDLATDPGEETNLAEARPDKLAELQSALAQHNADQPMTADAA